jgi:N utilization substance protein B
LDVEPDALAAAAPERVEEAIELFFESFDSASELREDAATLVKGTTHNLAQLDEALAAHSPNWKLSRMGRVERNVLRLCAFELLVVKTEKMAVILDEGIELAKRFGNTDSGAFVNGVLDALAKGTS